MSINGIFSGSRLFIGIEVAMLSQPKTYLEDRRPCIGIGTRHHSGSEATVMVGGTAAIFSSVL